MPQTIEGPPPTQESVSIPTSPDQTESVIEKSRFDLLVGMYPDPETRRLNPYNDEGSDHE